MKIKITAECTIDIEPEEIERLRAENHEAAFQRLTDAGEMGEDDFKIQVIALDPR